MLCKISVQGASPGAQQANLMRGVHAIATAAAGSTPSVTGTTGHESFGGGTMTSQYEIITEVIANTEAGGWEVSHPTSLSTVQKGDGYWTTNSSDNSQALLLRTSSGKADKPYAYFFILSSNRNISTNTAEMPTVGCHFGSTWNSANFVADITPTSPSAISSGTGFIAVNSYNSSTGTGISNVNQSLLAAPAGSGREYYVACNSEFIHIQAIDGTGQWVHFGMREHQAWEDLYEDNPYWVLMSWSCNQDFDFMDACTYTQMRHLYHTTQSVAGPFNIAHVLGSYTTTSSTWFSPCDWGVTGEMDQRARSGADVSTATADYNFRPTNIGDWTDSDGYTYGVSTYTADNSAHALQGPIWRSPWTFTNNTTIYEDDCVYGPVSDAVTGALIPPAIPMNIMAAEGRNSGGKMKYIYQSLTCLNSTDLKTYWSEGAAYTVNNQTYHGMSYGKSGAHNYLFLVHRG